MNRNCHCCVRGHACLNHAPLSIPANLRCRNVKDHAILRQMPFRRRLKPIKCTRPPVSVMRTASSANSGNRTCNDKVRECAMIPNHGSHGYSRMVLRAKPSDPWSRFMARHIHFADRGPNQQDQITRSPGKRPRSGKQFIPFRADHQAPPAHTNPTAKS